MTNSIKTESQFPVTDFPSRCKNVANGLESSKKQKDLKRNV